MSTEELAMMQMIIDSLDRIGLWLGVAAGAIIGHAIVVSINRP